MKIWALFFLFLLLSMAISTGIDLMMGIKLSMAIRNMEMPFSFMSIPEYGIVFVLLSIMFIPPIASFFQQRRQAHMRKKS